MPARTAALRAHQLSFATSYRGQPCAYCHLIHDWPDGFTVSRSGQPVCRGCARARLPAGYAHLAIALDAVDQALAAADRPLRQPMLRSSTAPSTSSTPPTAPTPRPGQQK